MVSPQEIAQIDYEFKQRLEYSKLRRAARGKEHRLAAHNARLSKGGWRTLSGIQFFIHEFNHPGTRPFAIGFGYVCVCVCVQGLETWLGLNCCIGNVSLEYKNYFLLN